MSKKKEVIESKESELDMTQAVATEVVSEEVQVRDVEGLVPDCLFPSDNDLEVPTLRLDVQPKVCDIPFICFGEQKRTHDMQGNGTLHFYTDDYRFTAVYEHPERILKHNPRNIVEPNFSLFGDMPVAFGLQAIYKKRWIARMMQERGIPVFVDLNVNSKFYKVNMLGVPFGYRAFCTRGYSDRLAYLEYEYEIAKMYAGEGVEPLFVIYGGGEPCKQFAKKHGCVYVTPMITMKNSLRSKQKITESIAFGEEFEVSRLLAQATENTFNGQVLDYRDGRTIELPS